MANNSMNSSDSTAAGLQETSEGARVARTLFIVIFILIGFVGNSALVATIAQSNRLRKTTLNLFILSIAAVNILDSLVNLPLILGASVLEKWNYGSFVCQLNASCVQLTSIVTLLGLMMMTLDRFFAVRRLILRVRTQEMTVMRANILIVYCWTHGLALCLVLVINIVPVSPQPARYLCSISHGASVVYVCFLSTFGYILPILLTLMLFVYIIKVCISEKIRESKQSSRHTYNENHEVDHNVLRVEINAAKLIGILLILWCVCEGPYLLLSSIDHYRYSKELSEMSDTSGSFPWQLETAFTWLRLSYVMVLPIVSVIWCREVWQNFKKQVVCNKNNLIKTIAPRREQKPVKEKAAINEKAVKAESRTSLRSKKANEKESKDLSFINGSVPVLFATANGLHYQTPGIKQNGNLSDSDGNVTEADTTDTTLTQVLTSRKCDVGIGEEDTSDYDSQVEDPFTTSNPISVRSKLSNSDHPISRNNSDNMKGNLYDSVNPNQITNHTDIKKKRTRHNSRDQQIDINQSGNDDKTSYDSGTGSIGRKRKSKHETKCDFVDADNHHDSLDHVNGNIESENNQNLESNDNVVYKPKKRKKKRNRRQTHVGDANAVELSVTHDQSSEYHQQHSPHPPPRILPKLDIQTESSETIFNKVSDHERSKNVRPLPELPGIKPTRPHYRQLSDNSGEQPLEANGAHNGRAYKRQYSADDMIRSQSVRPTPSPRKSAVTPQTHSDVKLYRERSKSQAHLLENGVSGGVVAEPKIDTGSVPVPKARRKKRVDI